MAGHRRRVPGACGRSLLTVGVLAILAAQPQPALARAADQPAAAILHADSLRDGVLALPHRWRFHPGHDPAFADPAFDDGDWELADVRLPAADRPEAWDGHGWFRLRLEVDSSLHHRPLGLVLQHYGASEVYLDGKMVARIGRPAVARDETEPRTDRHAHTVSLSAGAHVLAVRYAQPPDRAGQQMYGPGFAVRIVESDAYARTLTRQIRRISGTQFFFVALFLAFALLHLVLFAFHRRGTEHLWFGVLAAVMAGLAFGMMQWSFLETVTGHLNRLRAMTVLLALLGIVLLRFAYGLFYERLPRQFYAFLAAGAGVATWVYLAPEAFAYLFGFMVLACLEVVRATVSALMRRKPGARVLGFGLSLLAGATAFSLLQELGVLPFEDLIEFVNPVTGATVLVIAMSVYLSRQVARTNEDLEAQLEEVRRLSEEQLRQERRAREAEVQRQVLEAENARRARELDEARQLQLSMLPSTLPEVPGLEIAAYMSTATEVGGDYYDFAVSPAGTLTVAVGDATGHGMRAGTVVTAAKSLLSTLGEDEPLEDFLARASAALRRLELPGLYMGLLLARWDGRTLRIASAGMPPMHIWRGGERRLETVTLKALPLGGPTFPYCQQEVRLHPGDVALLMTDGFPERFDAQREQFGYDEAAEAFASAAAADPDCVIDQLVARGEVWAGGVPPNDDVTFVTLRVSA